MRKRITDECIAVADEMHRLLPGWQATDETLRKAAIAFPSDDFHDVLAKVVLINELYSTSLYATKSMAEHISRIFGGGDPKTTRTVDAVASLPRPSRNCRSLASKYFHFYVSADFHILDNAACEMLSLHTGIAAHAIKKLAYVEYHALTEWVLAQHGNPPWGRSLDRYLWLGGLLLRKDARKPLNGEVKDLFERERLVERLRACVPPSIESGERAAGRALLQAICLGPTTA